MTQLSRRHLTTGVTLLVLVLVLCGMAVWGWRHATAPIAGQQASSEQGCPPGDLTRTRFLRPTSVTVSVFNAGNNSGLAGRTMNRLEGLGFQPGQVGNARATMHVHRAVVHTTRKQDPAAKLVARNLGKHVRIVVTGNTAGPGVDVFVGNHFHHLPKHPPKKVRLAKPVRQCVQAR